MSFVNKIIYTPDAGGVSAKIGGNNYHAKDKETLLKWAKEMFPHLEFETVCKHRI